MELLTSLVVHKVILGKALDLARDIFGQLIKVILLPLRNHLQHLALLLGREIIVTLARLTLLAVTCTLLTLLFAPTLWLIRPLFLAGRLLLLCCPRWLRWLP